MIATNRTLNAMFNSPNRQSRNAMATGVWELWIDSVGGFRLLEGDRFTIGGSGGDDPADIAVRSAWRSQMAMLRRVGDDFWLQRGSTTQTGFAPLVSKEPVASPVVCDAVLPVEFMPVGTMGQQGFGAGEIGKVDSGAPGPRLRLRKPSPLSGTVVLLLDPPHRFVVPVDAMILVDKTVLIGPDRSNHIRAPQQVKSGFVLLKRADQWWVRQSDGSTKPMIEGERVEIDNLVMTIRRDKTNSRSKELR